MYEHMLFLACDPPDRPKFSADGSHLIRLAVGVVTPTSGNSRSISVPNNDSLEAFERDARKAWKQCHKPRRKGRPTEIRFVYFVYDAIWDSLKEHTLVPSQGALIRSVMPMPAK